MTWSHFLSNLLLTLMLVSHKACLSASVCVLLPLYDTYIRSDVEMLSVWCSWFHVIACRLNYICGLRITLHTFSRDTSNMSARITSGSRLEFKTYSWRTCRLLCNDGDAVFLFFFAGSCGSVHALMNRRVCTPTSSGTAVMCYRFFFSWKKKGERGPKIGYTSVSLACSTACELFLRGGLWDSCVFFSCLCYFQFQVVLLLLIRLRDLMGLILTDSFVFICDVG